MACSGFSQYSKPSNRPYAIVMTHCDLSVLLSVSRLVISLLIYGLRHGVGLRGQPLHRSDGLVLKKLISHLQPRLSAQRHVKDHFFRQIPTVLEEMRPLSGVSSRIFSPSFGKSLLILFSSMFCHPSHFIERRLIV